MWSRPACRLACRDTVTSGTVIAVLFLALEVHDEQLNMHRFYSITVGKDLFGLWAIDTVYGRKELFRPSRGKQKTYMVDSLHEAKQKVSQILKKRFSSPRTGGKPRRPPYSLIEVKSQETDLISSDWFPA